MAGSCRRVLVALVLLRGGAVAGGEALRLGPVSIRGVSMVSLGKRGFDKRGRRLPRQPVRVIPYGGTFKLTMDVERIEPGRPVKWVAWFGNLVSKGYTETDDAKAYRSRKGPATEPIASIVGLEGRFRGRAVWAVAKSGVQVRPSGGKAGAAYSFHVTAKGHNSALYPLWMRPVKEGENILYATVHQRFVYHLMFRLTGSHFARYELAAHARQVARMMLPYTILLVEGRGGRKRLLCVYQGEVALNAFPVEQLRRGAGVTVASIRTAPRLVWPDDAAGVSWGKAVGGVQLGLLPPAGPFRAGLPMQMSLLLRNVGRGPRKIRIMRPCGLDVPVGHDFRPEVRRADGTLVPVRGECLKKHAFDAIELKPGETREFLLDLLSQRCLGLRQLPPGNYTVLVRHGLLATGSLALEILPAGRPEEEATADPNWSQKDRPACGAEDRER